MVGIQPDIPEHTRGLLPGGCRMMAKITEAASSRQEVEAWLKRKVHLVFSLHPAFLLLLSFPFCYQAGTGLRCLVNRLRKELRLPRRLGFPEHGLNMILTRCEVDLKVSRRFLFLGKCHLTAFHAPSSVSKTVLGQLFCGLGSQYTWPHGLGVISFP